MALKHFCLTVLLCLIIIGCGGSGGFSDIPQPPVARAKAMPNPQTVGEPVNFSDDGSYDPDGGSIVKYEWDWNNDGVYDAQGAQAQQTWGSQGTYNIQFRVTDDEGVTGVLNQPLQVSIEGSALNPINVTPPWLYLRTNELCIDGHYLYIAEEHFQIRIVDISDPHNLNWVKSVHTSDLANAIAVSDGYAYVALDVNRLQIIDVDPPETAHTIRTISWDGGYTKALAISGGYAYITCSYGYLQIIDIDPPAEAQYVNRIQIHFPLGQGIAASDGYAYIGNGHYLNIVDVDPPESTQIINIINLPDDIHDIAISNGYAYLTGKSFQVVDIDPPESAHSVTSVDCGGFDAVVSGDYAYMLASSGLRKIDINPPESAHIVGSVDYELPANSLAVSGGYAYLGHSKKGGFQIIDIDPIESGYVVDAYESIVDGLYFNVGEYDGYAYAGNLWVFDANPPEETRILTNTDLGLGGYGLYKTIFSDDYAYFLLGSGYAGSLKIVNVDPPDSPSVCAHLANNVNGFAYSNGYIFVASDAPDPGLYIMDVDPPESSHIVSTVDTIEEAWKVDFSDGYLYVYVPDRLVILEFNPPDSTEIVGSVEGYWWCWDLVVSGGYAYVVGRTTLRIIDIDPPESAHEVQTVSVGGDAHYVAISGGYAYVAADQAGLQIIDITPPESAEIVCTIRSPPLYTAKGVAVSGNYVFVTDPLTGLCIYKLW